MGEADFAHDRAKGLYELVIFLIALVTGTASSILSKVLMDMSGTGMDGKTHTFARPLAQTLGMFLGMIAGLPMHAIVVWWKIPFPGYRHDKSSRMLGSDEENMPLVPTGNLMDNPNTVPYWMHLYLAIPALFDLLATALSMVGLRYLDVSVYQLLRGSGIIFVAVMKQSVLKDRLYRFQWVGVSWNVVAVLLVGVAALLDSTQDEKIKTSTTIIGILVMLLATFIQSLQFVFEEKVMTADENKAPPLLLFGMEGLWGTFLCCAILYPIAYWIPGDDNGSFEDPFNTWALLMNTRLLQIMFTFYVLAILAYNLFSILVTLDMSSVWHSILDNFRPVTVWATDLFLYYLVTNGRYGETWTNNSWVQLGGLLVLLYGTSIYNAPDTPSIRLEGQWYAFGMDLRFEYAEIEIQRIPYLPGFVKWFFTGW